MSYNSFSQGFSHPLAKYQLYFGLTTGILPKIILTKRQQQCNWYLLVSFVKENTLISCLIWWQEVRLVFLFFNSLIYPL